MQTSGKIIEILKQDPKANELITILNEIANKNKFTEEQYNHARGTMLLLATLNNPEAFKTLSDSVWEKINRKNDEIEFAQIWHENVRGF